MLSRGDHGWCFKWLQALDLAGYMCSTTHLGMDPPDFLLPNVDEFGVVASIGSYDLPSGLEAIAMVCVIALEAESTCPSRCKLDIAFIENDYVILGCSNS